MSHYRNFRLATYFVAHGAAHAEQQQLQKDIDFFQHYLHLDNVYLEPFRDGTFASEEQVRMCKEVFEQNGIHVSGGITTAMPDPEGAEPKQRMFGTLCYNDEAMIRQLEAVAEMNGRLFDQWIIDDFYFTNCTCDRCRAERDQYNAEHGITDGSWEHYRSHKMVEVSRNHMIAPSKRVNPDCKVIIKYPNWYESYQETGYNPGKQKDIFDMIYTGTETRNACYSPQHLQLYESYSIIHLLENTAPGRNGGGWIDQGGSSDNLSRWLDQANATMLAKAKELMLFNFAVLVDSPALPPLGQQFYRIDEIVGKCGNPVGVAAWEPFDADGEDQLYNYLGQCGLAVEPSPYFNDKAPTVLLTQSSACEPDAMEKLEKYVRQGGNAVVTVGFVHETYDKGIKDMTSVRLTHRHVLSNEFMVSNMNYLQMEVERSDDPILFEVLDYKTNATHSDITILAGEDNFPMMTEDNYGKGRLFILNVPENFADLYKLPKSVVRAFNKHLSMGQRVFVAAHPQVNFFAYDNNVYGIQSHRPMPDSIQVIVRGECKGLRDIETGRVYDEKLTMPKPGKKGDATTVIPEPTEYAFEVQMFPGRMMFFEVID